MNACCQTTFGRLHQSHLRFAATRPAICRSKRGPGGPPCNSGADIPSRCLFPVAVGAPGARAVVVCAGWPPRHMGSFPYFCLRPFSQPAAVGAARPGQGVDQRGQRPRKRCSGSHHTPQRFTCCRGPARARPKNPLRRAPHPLVAQPTRGRDHRKKGDTPTATKGINHETRNRAVSNHCVGVWRSGAGRFGASRRCSPGRARFCAAISWPTPRRQLLGPASMVPRAKVAGGRCQLGHERLPHLVLGPRRGDG
jgi:hypothetical protein